MFHASCWNFFCKQTTTPTQSSSMNHSGEKHNRRDRLLKIFYSRPANGWAANARNIAGKSLGGFDSCWTNEEIIQISNILCIFNMKFYNFTINLQFYFQLHEIYHKFENKLEGTFVTNQLSAQFGWGFKNTINSKLSEFTETGMEKISKKVKERSKEWKNIHCKNECWLNGMKRRERMKKILGR